MMLAHHGVMIATSSVAQAFDLAYYLERAAMVQYLAQQSGQIRMINDDVVKITFQQ